jgi:hypothetical protein
MSTPPRPHNSQPFLSHRVRSNHLPTNHTTPHHTTPHHTTRYSISTHRHSIFLRLTLPQTVYLWSTSPHSTIQTTTHHPMLCSIHLIQFHHIETHFATLLPVTPHPPWSTAHRPEALSHTSHRDLSHPCLMRLHDTSTSYPPSLQYRSPPLCFHHAS